MFWVFTFYGIFCPISNHDPGHVFKFFWQISCLIFIINTSSLFFSCTWTWTCHIHFLRINIGHLSTKYRLLKNLLVFFMYYKNTHLHKNKYHLIGKQTIIKNKIPGGSIFHTFLPPLGHPQIRHWPRPTMWTFHILSMMCIICYVRRVIVYKITILLYNVPWGMEYIHGESVRSKITHNNICTAVNRCESETIIMLLYGHILY